ADPPCRAATACRSDRAMPRSQAPKQWPATSPPRSSIPQEQATRSAPKQEAQRRPQTSHQQAGQPSRRQGTADTHATPAAKPEPGGPRPDPSPYSLPPYPLLVLEEP